MSRRERRSVGCCTPLVEPHLRGTHARTLARVAKALGDPTRVMIVDALRRASPEAVCQCELLPLFEMSQPALAKHLRVLVGAEVLASERRGLWTYYYVLPDALEALSTWLSH